MSDSIAGGISLTKYLLLALSREKEMMMKEEPRTARNHCFDSVVQ